MQETEYQFGVKPIETKYDGYRFRSRLEARWAVFFKTLGLRYQYEPEGFVLPDGTCYLPDFWLPELEIFIEVKPTSDDGLSDATLRKALGLHASTGHVVCVLMGTPEHAPSGKIRQLPFAAEVSRGSCIESVVWTHCLWCGYIGFEPDGLSEGLRCCCPITIKRSLDVALAGSSLSCRETPRLLGAYEAARSERFGVFY